MAPRKKWICITACVLAMLCASIAVIIISCTSGEPDFVVAGTVLDATTGQSIAGARVSDDGYGPKPYRGATTDSTGKYHYNTWGEEHGIVTQAPGYKAQRQTLTTSLLQTEKKKVLNFQLTRE